jgi:hypothetical protein
MRKGLFAKHGIEVESIAFAGDARMQQMMATDSLDIALGSGLHHGVHRQGVPIKATAAMASHSRAPRLNLRLGRAGDGHSPQGQRAGTRAEGARGGGARARAFSVRGQFAASSRGSPAP